MSLESVEEVETAPSGSFTEEVEENPEKSDSGETPDLDLSGNALAKPRRKSLSKLKRRLSRTFRLSFSGSLSDFAHTFTIDERSEYTDQNGGSGSAAGVQAKSLDAEDILPSKFNGHHVPSVQSRLRTISNLTRKLSLSNSRIIENPSRRLSASSSTSRLNNNGIGKTLLFFVKRQKADVVINFCVCFVHF